SLRIDKRLASQERETAVGICRALASSGKKTPPNPALLNAPGSKPVTDKVPIPQADRISGYLLLFLFIIPAPPCHPATAWEGACAVGLGQIALYALALNDRARNEPLRSAFKLYALQRCGPSISHQSTCSPPKHDDHRGLETHCSRQ